MGLNKASDFQGAYVAFFTQLAENPKTPRFGGAKISSPSPSSPELIRSLKFGNVWFFVVDFWSLLAI